MHIADNVNTFVAAAEQAMRADRAALRTRVDAFLDGNSWDATWAQMRAVIELEIGINAPARLADATSPSSELAASQLRVPRELMPISIALGTPSNRLPKTAHQR